MSEVTEKFQPEGNKLLRADYKYFERSYEGGSAYRDGSYLLKHKRESDGDYERRLKQSSFVNFCADVVDIYNSYLYREQPSREIKNKTVAVETFLKDADLEGRPWAKVMRNTSKMAGFYGVLGAIIDKLIDLF